MTMPDWSKLRIHRRKEPNAFVRVVSYGATLVFMIAFSIAGAVLYRYSMFESFKTRAIVYCVVAVLAWTAIVRHYESKRRGSERGP